MLTYSVKPRGGVVHALEVSEALARRGHDVELFALARPGEELFRPTPRAAPTRPPRAARRAVRRAHPGDARRPTPRGCGRCCGGYDVVHTQDCLSANAALALRDEGVIDHVHAHRPPRRRLHVAVADRVPGPLDRRARPRAVRVAAVGGAAARRVRRRAPASSPTASTAAASGPPRDGAERADARRLAGLGERFAVLTVGGIEPRKGSLTLLEGFAKLRERAARARPAADRRRHDAVRLPARARALRRRARTSSA